MRVLVLSVNVAHSMTIKRFRLIKKGGLKNYFSEKKKTSRLNTVVNNLVPSSGCWCVDIQKGPELMRRGGSLTFPPRFRPLMSPAGRSLTSGPPAVRADNADPRCTGAEAGGVDDAHHTRRQACLRNDAGGALSVDGPQRGSPTLLSHKHSSLHSPPLTTSSIFLTAAGPSAVYHLFFFFVPQKDLSWSIKFTRNA